jgi:hypothetical protein
MDNTEIRCSKCKTLLSTTIHNTQEIGTLIGIKKYNHYIEIVPCKICSIKIEQKAIKQCIKRINETQTKYLKEKLWI